MNTEDFDHAALVRGWLQEPISVSPIDSASVARRVAQTQQRHGPLPMPDTGGLRTMLSATRLIVAGVVIVLFGGFVLFGGVPGPELGSIGGSVPPTPLEDPAVARGTAPPSASASTRPNPDGLGTGEQLKIRTILAFPDGIDPIALVRGPRGGAYYIDEDTGTIDRIDLEDGKRVEIAAEGDKPGKKRTLGVPVQLEAGGRVIVITDDKARLWRWRPSNDAGDGTLARLTLLSRATLGDDHGDMAAYSPSVGGYRLYVVEPSRNQIMRYQQTFDGSAFQEPTPYLVTPDAAVGDFGQLYVDLDVYALYDNALRRYRFEKYDREFELEDPPEAADGSRSHDYRLVSGTGSPTTRGKLYLYDALNARIVGFSKEDGSVIGQWAPGLDGAQMDDVRGMYASPGKKGKNKQDPDTLVWITPEGLYEAVLEVGTEANGR